MNSVKLKLVGINSKLIPNIFIDDQYVKCKKNEFEIGRASCRERV